MGDRVICGFLFVLLFGNHLIKVKRKSLSPNRLTESTNEVTFKRAFILLVRAVAFD